MDLALDALSPADRGFVTWLATMLREPVAAVWARLGPVPADAPGPGGTRVAGDQLVALDLTPIGPRLRYAAGAQRALSLPIAGLDALEALDCSGLDLDALDVRLLTRLRTLRCADNRLRELDLVASPSLETLDCARNKLLVLDLRNNPVLREVACSGNDLGLLALSAPRHDDPLEVLDVSRNQLMVLDVGDRPRLRVLRADHNALARVHLGALPALRELDLSRNDLDQIDASGAPGLTRLQVARNRLAACDVTGLAALRELRCHGNYVAVLDLRPCPALEVVDAHQNQLVEVHLGRAEHLVELDLADNRLTRLAVDAPALLQLDVSGNQLGHLALDHCPRLRSLDVSDNPLQALDPSPSPELVELNAADTRVAALDIRSNADLARLRTAPTAPGCRAPRVLATPLQQRRLTELRTALGLGTGASAVEELDAYELHDLALSVSGGRDADQRLLAIVTAPRCDLGTALMVYWTSCPHYYRRYATRDEVPPYELGGWDLLAAIEERAAAGGYATAQIAFDPTDDRQTRSIRGVDWTRAPASGPGHARAPGVPLRRDLPARLQEPVRASE